MKFRYARHTTDLKTLQDFYVDILQFSVLGSFEAHDNYDGIFLGKPDSNWHLEFTTSPDIPKQSTDEDDLLVFYPSNEEFEAINYNLNLHKIELLVPKNPYWKKNGIHFVDPDGFGIIIVKPTSL